MASNLFVTSLTDKSNPTTRILLPMRSQFVLALFIAVTSTPCLQAVPIQNPANGHYYDFVGAGPVTWTDARDGAAGSSHNGWSGYLATITSADENQFIQNTFNPPGVTFAWIGASDQAVEGEWRWVVGPESGTQFSSGSTPTAPFFYANWGGPEPNNAGNNEHHAGINLTNGEWGDGPVNAGNVLGYIVEYSDPTNTPEAGDLRLALVLSLAAMILITRNTRRHPNQF